MSDKSENQKALELSATIDTKIIHEGSLLTVKHDKITDSFSNIQEYDVVLHPGAVVIVPVDQNGLLYFVKQWRRAAQKILIEFPAGVLENKEKPQDCAERELQEEIGFYPKSLIPLGGFYTAPGFCDEYLHLFLGKDLIRSELKAEDTEKIDVITMSFEEALKAVNNELIIDAKTICSLYKYQQWQNNNGHA